MKKVFVMAFALSAMLFASCGNKTAAPNANADSTAVSDSMAVDSTSQAAVASDDVNELTGHLGQLLQAKDAKGLTALLESAKEKAAALAKTDPEAAKAYVSQLQNWLKGNAATIKTLVSSTGNDAVTNAVNTAIGAVTTINPEDVVNSLASQAKGDAQKAGAQLLEQAKEGVTQAVENSKVGEAASKAADVVNKAKAAKEAIDKAPAEAKQAAKEAAQKAVDKANKKAEERAEQGRQKAADAVNHAAGKALKGLGL